MKAALGLSVALAVLPGLAIAQSATMQTGAVAASTGTLLQQSSEYRFQLGMHVNDAALAELLPAGWVSGVATEGLGKGANVRLNFIDRFGITGPDGKVIGKGVDRLVYVIVPVKQANGEARGQMILAGISENGAEDDFGVLSPATKVKVGHSSTTENGVTLRTEDWDFAAGDGSHVTMHIRYEARPGTQGAGNSRTFDPADPTKFVAFRTEQMMDIARNRNSTQPDRVREFSFSVGGGRFASLFDGSEQPIAWDSLPFYSRAILQP